MRVLLAGGGSAGHIEPALAVADALRRADPDVEVTCLGTERGLETRLIPLRGYPLELIPAVPMPRSVTPQLLTVPGRLAGAINAAAGVMDRTRAQVLVGFGGYVATPAYLAARHGQQLRRHAPGHRHGGDKLERVSAQRDQPGLQAALGTQARHFDVRVSPPQGVRHRQSWFDVSGGPAAGKQYPHASSLTAAALSSALC